MDKKIVFIDIDGTHFDNDSGIVHKSTIDAIQKLKDNEINVVIASGRSQVDSDDVLKRFNLKFDGYVLINGQFVLYHDEVIYKNPLNEQFIKEFIIECNNRNIPYGFMTEKDTFVSHYDRLVVKSYDSFKMKLPRLVTTQDLNQEIFQGLFFNDKDINYFSQKFKQYVRFIPWHNTGADITPKKSSKVVGIKKICEKLCVSQENVYALGDSNNDIEMNQYARYGIAMGNANSNLKEVADYITDDIGNDGLAKALKKYNLI